MLPFVRASLIRILKEDIQVAPFDTSIAQNVYNGLSGTATATNCPADGTKTFTILNENGTFDSLVISDQRDANDSITSTTYPTGFYKHLMQKLLNLLLNTPTGVNDFKNRT